MTRIIWSPKSLRDLDAIEGYVAQHNPVAAKRLVQKIIQRTDRLNRFPSSGEYVAEDASRRYRQVLQGNYRVIYRYDPDANAAIVVAVIHAARLLDPDTMSGA
jgi:plasmid stabilization system protein ParE